jgi:hypothetical protein
VNDPNGAAFTGLDFPDLFSRHIVGGHHPLRSSLIGHLFSFLIQ